MRIFNKFVWSSKEPNNKNDIWFDGSVWKMFSQGEWEAFTVEKEAATKINKLIEDSFGVYQEKLTAGDGVIIENNIISTEKLYQVVKTLPDKGKHNTIYLVSSKNTEENNILTEYIWVNNDWEKLGEFKTDIDLTSYLTKTEAQTTYQPQEKGKGLSTNDYTTAEKNKLASLENYDDSGIKEELAKKAEKSEIPTKMSQLKQDVELGSNYLPREEFEERIEGYATNDSVQELSENVTELSEAIVLRNVGAEDTDESVEEPDLPTPTPSNEWKCVVDRRLEIGERFITATTFADGTPLVAKELICQVLIDKVSSSSMQGYVTINSTQNKTKSFYGAIRTEMNNESKIPCLSQIRLKTSPFTYMVAEISEDLIGKAAQGNPVKAVIGNTGMPQIYEDIVMVQFDNNVAVASSAPHIKIYAR